MTHPLELCVIAAEILSWNSSSEGVVHPGPQKSASREMCGTLSLVAMYALKVDFGES
jgi:hypothetical protein